jgi:hypothetical protein
MKTDSLLLSGALFVALCAIGCTPQQSANRDGNGVKASDGRWPYGPYCGTNAVAAEQELKARKDVLRGEVMMALLACQILEDPNRPESAKKDAKHILENVLKELGEQEGSLR